MHFYAELRGVIHRELNDSLTREHKCLSNIALEFECELLGWWWFIGAWWAIWKWTCFLWLKLIEFWKWICIWTDVFFLLYFFLYIGTGYLCDWMLILLMNYFFCFVHKSVRQTSEANVQVIIRKNHSMSRNRFYFPFHIALDCALFPEFHCINFTVHGHSNVG